MRLSEFSVVTDVIQQSFPGRDGNDPIELSIIDLPIDRLLEINQLFVDVNLRNTLVADLKVHYEYTL
jgi:hypothetical protein